MEFYKEHKGYINKLIYLLLFFLIVYIFIKLVLPFIAPFVFGYLFSLLLNPIVTYLVKKYKMHRGFVTAIIMLIFILILGILINLLAVNVVNQARGFVEALPSYAEEMSGAIETLENKYNRIFEFMPDNVKFALNSTTESLGTWAYDVMSGLLKSGGGELIKTIPGAVLGVLLWLISSFFFTKDKYIISKFIKELTPAVISDGFYSARNRMTKALKGYLKAQLAIMSMIATISIAGLLLLKYPYALFVGIIIAFVDALPLFGSGFILLPWAVISMLSGNYSRMISLLVLYLVIMLTRQVSEPKILGNELGIHPIATLISIYVGLKLFGILGIIIGPIAVVTAMSIFLTDEENT